VNNARKIKTGVLHRSHTISREHINEKERTVELSFSSETPVKRWFGEEVLDHSPSSIRLGRMQDGGPILVDHNPSDHVGTVVDVSISSDRRGRLVARFGRSDRANEIFTDIVDEIRKHVSVGYAIHRMQLEESSDDGDVFRATDWEPLEVSIVSVPADMTVGVGRSEGCEYETTIEGEKIMPDPIKKEPVQEPVQRSAPEPKINVQAIEDKARADYLTGVRDLEAIGNTYSDIGGVELARRCISEGKGVDDLNAMLLAETKRTPVPSAEIGLSKKEVKNFSFVRLINSLANPGDKRAQESAAFEMEVSAATEKQTGRNAQGMLVPMDVMISKRDLTTATGDTAKAGYTVATDLVAGSFIDVLRNAMVLDQAGATVLTGLQGNVAIPRKTAGATAYWVAEGIAPTEGNAVFDQVTLSPNSLAANQDYTRKLLVQSSMDIESMVRNDLAMSLAVELDRVGINGSGSGAEPTGILNTSGVGSVTLATNGGAPTWAMVVNLMKEVGIDNAIMGSLGYIANYATVGTLLQTPKVASTDSVMIMNMIETLLGYPVFKTNNAPSNLSKGTGSNLSAMLFGNFSDLLIGLWGSLDIIADPYTQSKAGIVQVTAITEADLGVRHAESFAECNEIITL